MDHTQNKEKETLVLVLYHGLLHRSTPPKWLTAVYYYH
jgi:hypothetical protein